MSLGRIGRTALIAVAICSFQTARPSLASAQAWVPPKGEGTVTLIYQNNLGRGHLGPTGKLASGEPGRDEVRAQAVTWEVDFGLTNRVAFSAAIPFVAARYHGGVPHRIGVHGQPSATDDGTYHGTLQDFRFAGRVNLWSRPLAVTPFAEVIVPSHHYESRGHAVVGQDLRALVLGTNVGGFLDFLVPGTYFQTQLSYSAVQKVVGIRPNRSRVDSEFGYFVTPRLALRFLDSFQTTHDGVEFPYAGLPPDVARNHDRLSRNNFLILGGGLGFAINESVDLFAVATTMVWGKNVHRRRGIGVGMNWHFRTTPVAARAARSQARTESTDRSGPRSF